MASRAKIELEVQVVVVSWRAAMRHVRSGEFGHSSESTFRIGVDALRMLDDIAQKYRERPIADRRDLTRLLAAARAEIHGATHHDLADSGESAG
jgi:hypothetical protein